MIENALKVHCETQNTANIGLKIVLILHPSLKPVQHSCCLGGSPLNCIYAIQCTYSQIYV